MRTVVDLAGFSIAKERPDGHNEDCFEFLPEPGDGPAAWADFAAIVVDGVGSSADPQRAAMMAAHSWLDHAEAKFIENGDKCAGFTARHFDEITRHAFVQAHEAVHLTAGSACAVAACIQGDKLIAGNVGDCRIYMISAGRLLQVSKDQVDSIGDPTDLIGGKRVPVPHTVSDIRVKAGDILILCTDGVWKYIMPADLLNCAVSGNAKDISARIEQTLRSRRKPESDDATAVVAIIKRIGLPFWENDSYSGESVLRDDLVENKLNEVLAELLNRIRTPLERQHAKADQAVSQLSSAVNDLKAELESLRAETAQIGNQRKPAGSDWKASYGVIALSVLLFIGGIVIGWELRDFAKSYKTRDITPELPQ
ncbi:MAG TPA: protein phosphatase 2C domain-containing protein, partial [Armatimonadota bacterium]|nr:protein phosphatase 2C domain-containing protein [Armatimonadota bacterium]